MCLLAAIGGCGGDSGEGAPERVDVVASFYPAAFLAEAIGGEAVTVTDLTPPGAEPHDTEVTAGDVRAIREADLVVFVGGGFQPAVEQAVEAREGPSLDLLGVGADPGLATATDPHLWLDPTRYAAAARSVGRALGRSAAAERLAARLEALDGELAAGLARCERREIVTSHAAFGHLARRYGLRQIALTGLEPEAEPSPRELERLVEAVRASGATTVFAEELLSSRLAETVARETGTVTATLDPLEGLTQERVAAGDDYFTVMRDNLAALRAALGCT
jgi:zinc transport system substrate-binding protein